jgi:hypothetical protein
MSSQPEDQQIDARNNPESQAAEADRPSGVARASDGGPPPADAPPAGERPAPAESGTAGGDPTAGVTISDADKEDAVSGDTGPTGSNQQQGPVSM